jgi:hypothetical protein
MRLLNPGELTSDDELMGELLASLDSDKDLHGVPGGQHICHGSYVG